MKTMLVESSWGELVIDEQGLVVRLENLEPSNDLGINYLPFITRFNLDEWKVLNDTTVLPDSFDIIELPYYWDDGVGKGYHTAEEYYNQSASVLMEKTVEYVLSNIYSSIPIDRPSNHEDILKFVVNDVIECADKDFNDSDVAIGFRRYIESKSNK